MKFADRLQELRKSKGFSQEYLAEQLNVSRQSVSKWETGTGYPETDKLLKLSAVLDVNLDYLFGDKHQEAPDKPAAQSPYIPYFKKWVRLFLNDNEYHGFNCIAIVGIGKSFLSFMDHKGKAGLLSASAIVSISESDTHKYKKLPQLSDLPSELLEAFPEYLDGRLCDIKLRQGNAFLSFTKPGGIYSVQIITMAESAITVIEQNGKTCTVVPSDILFIKER